MTILIIDNLTTMRRIIKNILIDLDFNKINEASNPALAMSILEKSTIELIITEYHFNESNGLEFVRKLKEQNTLKSIPILMVSAESNRGLVIEAIETGVNGFLIKPFTPYALKKQLDRIGV